MSDELRSRGVNTVEGSNKPNPFPKKPQGSNNVRNFADLPKGMMGGSRDESVNGQVGSLDSLLGVK